MSGKIIWKRKREDAGAHVVMNANVTAAVAAADETAESAQKRERLEAPPTAVEIAEEQQLPQELPNGASGTRNKILLEALQKIVELQNELDDFEHDLDESEHFDEELSFYEDEQQMQLAQDAQRRHEAEALGFAMCARETLLFLQGEGIASDSLLYRTLRQKLTGQTDGVIPI